MGFFCGGGVCMTGSGSVFLFLFSQLHVSALFSSKILKVVIDIVTSRSFFFLFFFFKIFTVISA